MSVKLEGLNSYFSQISQMMSVPTIQQDNTDSQFAMTMDPKENENSVGALPPTTSYDPMLSVTANFSSEDSSTSGISMSDLSSTFRANEDSILMTMENLGLTMDDLQDKDNLSALADAMNEGAINLGVPTVDNLDEAVDNLYAKISGTEESEGEGASAAGGGGGSSEDSDDTSTEVVIINGVPFLETTTTENGITTTTRVPLGFGKAQTE